MAAAQPAQHGMLAVATIPYKAAGSTILLPVEINGTKGWFILDSGGNSCVLDKAFARRIGLHPIAGGQASGAGRGTVPYDRYQEQVRFSVSGLPLDCPATHVIGLDLSDQPSIIGTAIDGILGTDFFASYVTEIDYARQVVRAYNPTSFSYSGNGCRLPLSFDHRIPHIRLKLTVDGKKAAIRDVLVDTGSQSAIDDDWILQSRKLVSAVGGVGLGETYATRLGRFTEAQIGCVTLRNVPGSGPGKSLVGGEVLQHFTLVFDWAHAQLIMEPGAGLSRDLADSAATGLDLRAETEGITIDWIGPGTPAQRAGLKKGDRLRTVDGTAAEAFGFSRLTSLFRVGRSYRLEIVREGRPLILILSL